MGLERCREELFYRIIEENKNRLEAIARTYADRLSHDDLYQEILLQIWRGLDGFAERCKLSTWVCSVAVNTALYFRRTAAAQRKRLTQDPDASGESQAVMPGPLSEVQILEDFIDSLGKTDQVLFQLFLDNVSYGEISDALDVDEGVIRMKITRIRRKFIERYLET